MEKAAELRLCRFFCIGTLIRHHQCHLHMGTGRVILQQALKIRNGSNGISVKTGQDTSRRNPGSSSGAVLGDIADIDTLGNLVSFSHITGNVSSGDSDRALTALFNLGLCRLIHQGFNDILYP